MRCPEQQTCALVMLLKDLRTDTARTTIRNAPCGLNQHCYMALGLTRLPQGCPQLLRGVADFEFVCCGFLPASVHARQSIRALQGPSVSYLDCSCVRKNAPVHEEQNLAVEVDESFVHRPPV